MTYIYKKVDLESLDEIEKLSLQEIAQYALRSFLFKKLNIDRVFFNRQSICVKAFNENSLYPEIKERESANKADIYVLAVVDKTKKVVYLEGWCSKDDLIQDKNKTKDMFYLSYKDLRDLDELLKNATTRN